MHISQGAAPEAGQQHILSSKTAIGRSLMNRDARPHLQKTWASSCWEAAHARKALQGAAEFVAVQHAKVGHTDWQLPVAAQPVPKHQAVPCAQAQYITSDHNRAVMQEL